MTLICDSLVAMSNEIGLLTLLHWFRLCQFLTKHSHLCLAGTLFDVSAGASWCNICSRGLTAI